MMRAHVAEVFELDGHRLFLLEELDGGARRVLMADGTWRRVESYPAMLPEGAGLPLPNGAWRAIAELAAPMATAGEVRRLEEALELERARVEHVLTQRPALVFVKGDGLVPYTAEAPPP